MHAHIRFMRQHGQIVVPRTLRLSKVWADLLRLKGTIVEEPESSAEFNVAKRRYEDAIEVPGGGHALLLAVYRGKISEVIRAEVVTGLLQFA